MVLSSGGEWVTSELCGQSAGRGHQPRSAMATPRSRAPHPSSESSFSSSLSTMMTIEGRVASAVARLPRAPSEQI